MALTDSEKKRVAELKAEGKSLSEIMGYIGGDRTGRGSSVSDAEAKAFRQNERSLVSRIATDIPSDISEGFGGAVDAVSRGMETAEGVQERIATPVEEDGTFRPATGGEVAGGVLQSVGGGLRAGAETIGEGLLTLGKLFTTPEAEQAIKSGVESGAESLAQTQPVQAVSRWYQGLSPESQRNVSGALGVAEGLGTMFGAGPAFKAFRQALSKTAGAVGDVAGGTVRAVGEATEGLGEGIRGVTSAVGGAVQPATDIAGGIARQGADFVTRTAREAQDTAQTARRIASLPEPEAKLIRTGADERVVNVIKQAAPEEVSIYRELVDQAKRKEADPTPNTAQPKEIAGREFLKPVDYLITQRDEVGSRLGEVRDTLSTSPTVDINPQFRQFQQYLTQDLGLRIDKNGKLISGTGRIADSDLKEIQKLYSDLRSQTIGQNIKSQKWIDEWLQRTFKEYDLRQAREQTFSDDVTRVASRARAILRQSMPEEYNALSTQYAEVMKPIQDMVKLLGYKGDIEQLTAKELRAGEVALRVLGNAAARPQDVIDGVLQTAQKYGYESDVDLNRLIYITDQLEDLYDITPSRGFSGSTARGVDQSGIGALGEAATLNLGGLFNRALSSRASRQEVREAFEAFLGSLPNQ